MQKYSNYIQIITTKSHTIFQVDNHLLVIIICKVKVRLNVDIYINRAINLNVASKKRMLAMENSPKYCINDIVFARCRSDPFWPAKVIKVISDHHVYQVVFFNHNTKAYIEEENILPFAPDTIKKQKKAILSKMREHKLLQKTRLMIIKGIDLALEESKKLLELNESLLQNSGQCRNDHSKEKERQLTLEISFQAMKKRKRSEADIISDQSSKRRKLNETEQSHIKNEQKERVSLQETSRDSLKDQNYSMEQAEYNLQRKFSHLCRKQRHLKKLQQRNRQQKEEIQSLRKNSDCLQHLQKDQQPSISYKHYESTDNIYQIKKYQEEVFEGQNESVILATVKIPELEQIPAQKIKQKQQAVQIQSKQEQFVERQMGNMPIIESTINNSTLILSKQPIKLNVVTSNCAKSIILLVEDQIQMVFKSKDQQLAQSQHITADYINRNQADKESQNQAPTLQDTLLQIQHTQTDNTQQIILPSTSIQHEVPFSAIGSKPQIEWTKIKQEKEQGEVDLDSYLDNIVDQQNENPDQIGCRSNWPPIDNLSLLVKQNVSQNGPVDKQANIQQQENALIDNNKNVIIIGQKSLQEQKANQNYSFDVHQIIDQVIQGQKVNKMAYELESGEVLESRVQQPLPQIEEVLHQVFPENNIEKQSPIIQTVLKANQPVYVQSFIKEQGSKLDNIIVQFVSRQQKIQDEQSNIGKLERQGDFEQHQNPLLEYELIRQEYTRQLYQNRTINTQPLEDSINIGPNVQQSQEEQVEEDKQVEPMQIQQSEQSFNDQSQQESIEIKINLKQVPNQSEIQEEQQLSCPESNPVFDVLQKKLNWDEQISSIEEMYDSQFAAPTNYPYMMTGLISLQNRITDFPQSLLVRTLKPYLERILTYLSCNYNNNQILLTMAQKQILIAIITSDKLTASTLSEQGILSAFQKIVDLYQSSLANKKNWVSNYCLEYLMVKEKLNYFTFMMRNFIVINDDDDQNCQNRQHPIYA